ncbi:hypothetical protein ACJZ2D_017196 [Fusarium nematophilum]
MSQRFLTLRNGSLSFKKIERYSSSFRPASGKEWIRSHLDDISQDVFQCSENSGLRQSSNGKSPNSLRRSRSQFRLVNRDGVVTIRRPQVDYSDSSDDIATTTDNRIANPHDKSRISFMQLPIEVRLCIYSYLLVSDVIICLDASGFRVIPPEKDDEKYGLHPEILATCRQISREGTSALYSQNVFHREFLWRIAYTFTESGAQVSPQPKGFSLKTANLELISRLRLFRGYHKWFCDNGDLKVLQDFPSLRELQIRIDLGHTAQAPKNLLEPILRALKKHQRPIYLKTRIRLAYNKDYYEWSNRCRKQSLDFSLHRAAKTELETWMEVEGLVFSRGLIWSFTTHPSRACGPSAFIDFTANSSGKVMQLDVIKCYIYSEEGIKITLEPA